MVTVIEDTIPPPPQTYRYGMTDVSPVSAEGDLVDFRNWVQSNVEYPESMLLKEVQGRVVASFVIDTEGNLTDIKIRRGLCKEADDEVMRILSLSKPWTPCQYQGQVVDIEVTLPVTFRMSPK